MDIAFAAKMSRRSILIAYRDQANTLSLNACPITTQILETQKLSPGDFLDFCKEFLNQPSKKEPDYLDFSRTNLISMQYYPLNDIGLLMLVEKQDNKER